MDDKPSGRRQRRLKGAMIGGSDAVTQIVRDLSVPVKLKGINDFSKHLDDFPILWERVHISPNYFRQNWRWDLRKYDIVCNLVTDGDRNPKTLKVAQRMAEKCDRPMINAPARVWPTIRDNLPKAIGDIPGVIMPRTVRVKNATPDRVKTLVAREELSWPLLVRKPGTHSGNFLGLFQDLDGLAPHLTDPRASYLLTEFVDFASSDGLYRKRRFFFIGDRILLRHLITAESWNVHARERNDLMMARPDLRQEEEEALRAQLAGLPESTIAALKAIQARIGLDYFGIDCHVTPEGEVLVFESNATMNYLPYNSDPEYFYVGDSLGDITREAVRGMLEDKLGRSLHGKAAPGGTPTTPASAPALQGQTA